MNNVERVSRQFKDVPYMREDQASVLRELIEKHDAKDILEIGFYHGKSSAYIAAILEDLRRDGHLVTIDREPAKNMDPNILTVLEQVGLQKRVTPIFAHRSYTWEMKRLIVEEPRRQFDLCYFDGGHTWDNTGFGVLLVDMLLRPGGIIVMDDMNWSIATSPAYKNRPASTSKYDDDEQSAMPVRLVWDYLLPHLGYTQLEEKTKLKWGVAQKGV